MTTENITDQNTLESTVKSERSKSLSYKLKAIGYGALSLVPAGGAVFFVNEVVETKNPLAAAFGVSCISATILSLASGVERSQDAQFHNSVAANLEAHRITSNLG